MAENMELVFVDWVDAAAPQGWTYDNQIEDLAKTHTIQSIGWLVRDEKEVIVVAGHKGLLGDDLQWEGIMVIPKSAIKAIHHIKPLMLKGKRSTQLNLKKT
jgi:hypothetical protein